MSTADTRLTFRYLSEPDMVAAGVTDMSRCVDVMEETLRLVDAGDYRMGGPEGNSHGSMVTFPAESIHDGMPLDGPHRRMMAMPAYLGGSFQTAGCKWYGSNMANRESGLPRSILMLTLSDKDTGAPLAHMSANLLSAYRTGAVPGVGARHLANPDARSVGIVAPGVMNRTTLEAFVAVRPALDTLKVAGRSRASIDSFVEWVRHEYPQFTTVTVVDSVEDAVRGSDLVTIAPTTPAGSANYVRIEKRWVKPGALVSLPADIMIDDEFLHGARHIADFRGLYEAWSEEVPHPAHEHIGLHGMYLLDRIRSGEVADEALENLPAIMSGEAEGRRNEDEVFLYSVGGMPVEDVAWGTVVYRRAVTEGIGTELLLWDAPALA
ncbi:MAG: ornithine cyclodeaminase [Microbacterium sp.]|nr:ornithine cyclodeaminase [Microbacterium sp.]